MVDLKSILPSQGKKKIGDIYWSLSVEPGWVQAGIWTIVDDSVQVISSSAPTSWEKEEELVEATDAALSSAVQTAPEDIDDPTKTVFGVPASWVSGGQIKEEYLTKIKKLCTELSLKPVGFVVLSEAVAHYIKSKEGSPLSAVVLGVSKEHIEVSYFKLGSLVATTEVARSVSIVDDVFEGFSRIADGNSMPSRIVLYNGRQGELEEVKQLLERAEWRDLGDIEFLHSPKIETTDSKGKISAVSLAGASEMADVTAVGDLEKEESIEDKSGVENIASATDKVRAEDLGFVLGKDVAESQESLKDYQEKESPENVQETADNERFDKEDQKKKKLAISFSFFGTIPSKIKGLLGKVKLPKLGGGSVARKPLVIGILFLLILLIGGFVAWWYLPKATVTIYISTKKLDERVSVSVDPSIDGIDLENGVLSGRLLSTKLNGEKTKQTTGTKTVGEKATGQVTIYRVGPSLTLSQGTVLNGPDDLDFVLDQDVSIASGSAGSPGSTKTNVTAEDIGAQYNLASNTTFTVSNYSTSDMEARNDDSFSGGTSREISAVSEDDRDDLLDELKTELEEKAVDELSDEIKDSDFFIEESLSTDEEKVDYSGKVGDEADTLKLSLVLDAQAIAVSENALNEVATKALESNVPGGFVLRYDQIDFDFEYKGQDDGIYDLDAKITANLLPEIDPDEIAQKIAGRYPELAKSYLTNELPGFVRAEIKMNPSFPGRLGTLPRIPKNIEVEISSER
jgi:hypothetical protein